MKLYFYKSILLNNCVLWKVRTEVKFIENHDILVLMKSLALTEIVSFV